MRRARRFDTLDEAVAALKSPTETDRDDACELLADVLERGIWLPREEPGRSRAQDLIAAELVYLVEREPSGGHRWCNGPISGVADEDGRPPD